MSILRISCYLYSIYFSRKDQLLSTILTQTGATKAECLTIEGSPVPNTPCVPKWKYKGKLRVGCITEYDPDDKPWCSTKVNPRTNEHINGNWGHCGSSCPRSKK